ncbi:MAG: FHA domain-containing protein [Bacteriovoracia bacterium]
MRTFVAGLFILLLASLAFSNDKPTSLTDVLQLSEGFEKTVVFRKNAHSDRVLIGRSKESQLQIVSPSVSRRHAMLYYIDGKYFIEDIGSSGGTLIDGVCAKQGVLYEIGPGQTVQIAEIEFHLNLSSQSCANLASSNSSSEGLHRFKISGYDGILAEHEPPFSQSRITVGRAEGLDIRLAAPSVSRRHCSVIRKANKWYIVDEGSKKGTYVDGKRLEKGIEVEISSDSKIQLGLGAFLKLVPLE